MRVLLDANVWVSGLLSPDSFSGRLLMAAADGRIDLLVPAGLVSELESVLKRPHISKRLDVKSRRDLLERLQAIQVPTSAAAIEFRPDPGDAYLLNSAIEFRALLVTGDRAIQDADVPLEVLSPKEACELLNL